MTPEQALQVLDQATASLNSSRAGHAQIAAALKVLADLVKAASVLVPSKEPCVPLQQ
jgi:hypothetical protein